MSEAATASPPPPPPSAAAAVPVPVAVAVTVSTTTMDSNHNHEWSDSLEADYQRLLSVGEECISASELKSLLLRKGNENDYIDHNADGKKEIRLYDGFEPSGRMHIAQGVFKAMNVNKCTAPFVSCPQLQSTFVFWVADWFALMNDKMGGDLTRIQTVGLYLQEVWTAAGMDPTHVQFVWASDEINRRAHEYWPLMLDIARKFNITRIKKCCQIMGRLENSLSAAQVLYPLMQCTDVFFLRADICQLGVDQRKVNMLAREYCDASFSANRKHYNHKPIILSHHMLYGLKAGQAKMSKSDPDSAIFMEDSADDVARKIRNAYCPRIDENAKVKEVQEEEEEEDAGKASLQLIKDTLKNPCLDYIQHIVFSPPHATFTAGGQTYADYATVRADFLNGSLTEAQLKEGLIKALNQLLEPVRNHFTVNENARDLLAKVQQYKKESSISNHKNRHDDDDDAVKTVRRLNLVEQGMVPANCHLVLAPLPTMNPTLQTAVDVLAQLNWKDANADADRPKVLYLRDWSARVCNACRGDVKAIQNAYTILLTAIKVLDDSNAVMPNTTIVWQSEAILKDPSNYWISVINVGRHFMLDTVMGNSLVDSEGVGFVIHRLMQVADLVGVEPASVSILEADRDPTTPVLETMVTGFYAHHLPTQTAPVLHTTAITSIRLQIERESQALSAEHDEYFVLDDPKQHGKSKLKKAFCEPGNIGFCPPIALACVFGMQKQKQACSTTTLVIDRSEDNGGRVEYSNREDIESDFASGRLHPGDLKAAVSNVMVQVLTDIAVALKADGLTNKACKELKAFEKKMEKKK